MLYLKSEIGTVARNLLFDQNVVSTWNRFKGEVEPILSDVTARFGLTDYRLVLFRMAGVNHLVLVVVVLAPS